MRMEKKLSSKEIKVARWFRKSKLNQSLMVLGQLLIVLVGLLLLQWIWPLDGTWGYILGLYVLLIIPVGFFFWIWDCLTTPSLEELEEEKK
jgi:hypothetical protein